MTLAPHKLDHQRVMENPLGYVSMMLQAPVPYHFRVPRVAFSSSSLDRAGGQPHQNFDDFSTSLKTSKNIIYYKEYLNCREYRVISPKL
jgi:hypothetical protein